MTRVLDFVILFLLMKQYWKAWNREVTGALTAIAEDAVSSDTIESTILIETPPDTAKGDIAFPMFPFARLLRKNPAAIASAVVEQLQGRGLHGRVEAAGPYVNVYLDRSMVAREIINQVLQEGNRWGNGDSLDGRRIMIEFSCPNTNKPLHLGHLRNDAIGESTARLLRAAGAVVHKVNLINDRGIHICKSMVAYQEFGEGSTPESTDTKSDHFVGDFYVRYAQWEKDDNSAEERARAMLVQWEQGDADVRSLWKLMNTWAIDGIAQTYQRTGVSFDATYFESETYTLGREEVLKGLESGVFYKDEAGTVWVDLQDIDLDKKVLLRGDGTSLYLTQDIGTAIQRYQDWQFDELMYVVASEQRYHFQVLFEVLGRLGKEWSGDLTHLAYGMVNLPDGKMKSREGTVVDADDLIDRLAGLAAEEIRSKGRAEHVGDVEGTAERIALAALHYYLLQTSPVKDMVFDPQESLSFSGNTGPYLQYLGARISSMLAKQASPGTIDHGDPTVEDEWALIHRLAAYPYAIADAARTHNPSMVAGALYDLAKTFSRFYHDHPIVVAEDDEQRVFRLALSKAVLNALQHGLDVLNIPFVESM